MYNVIYYKTKSNLLKDVAILLLLSIYSMSLCACGFETWLDSRYTYNNIYYYKLYVHDYIFFIP